MKTGFLQVQRKSLHSALFILLVLFLCSSRAMAQGYTFDLTKTGPTSFQIQLGSVHSWTIQERVNNQWINLQTGASTSQLTHHYTRSTPGIYVFRLYNCYPVVGCSYSSSKSVIINAAPVVTVSFSPNPVTIGQNSTLTWTASNQATSCSGAPTTATSGSAVLPIQSTSDLSYTITCSGDGGTGSGTAVLKVLPDNPASFSPSVSVPAVTLNWANSPGALNYAIYLGSNLLTTVTGNSYVYSPVTAGNTYNFTVKACNNNGCSSGRSTSVSIPNGPVVAVSFSPNPATIGQSSTLTWTSTNATSCSGAPTTATSGSAVLPIQTTSNLSYTISCSGPGGTGSDTEVLVVKPASPSGLSASATTTGVQLNWSASTGAASYEIRRNGSFIATSSTNSYKDTGAPIGSNLTYTVRACTSSGSCSADASQSTRIPTAPSAPTWLASNVLANGTRVNWTAPTDAVTYRLYVNSVQTSPTGPGNSHLISSPGSYQVAVVACNSLSQCSSLSANLPVTIPSSSSSAPASSSSSSSSLVSSSQSSAQSSIVSKVITYTYDALGRLTFVEDTQNGNRDYDYDAAGNRINVATGVSTD